MVSESTLFFFLPFHLPNEAFLFTTAPVPTSYPSLKGNPSSYLGPIISSVVFFFNFLFFNNLPGIESPSPSSGAYSPHPSSFLGPIAFIILLFLLFLLFLNLNTHPGTSPSWRRYTSFFLGIGINPREGSPPYFFHGWRIEIRSFFIGGIVIVSSSQTNWGRDISTGHNNGGRSGNGSTTSIYKGAIE